MLQKEQEVPDVADFLKISAQAVGRWLNENKLPAHDNLAKLADFYQVSVDDLAYSDLVDARLQNVALSFIAHDEASDYYTKEILKTHLLSIKKHLHDMNVANDRIIEIIK